MGAPVGECAAQHFYQQRGGGAVRRAFETPKAPALQEKHTTSYNWNRLRLVLVNDHGGTYFPLLLFNCLPEQATISQSICDLASSKQVAMLLSVDAEYFNSRIMVPAPHF